MSENQIPACVHASAYRGWAISIECDNPSPGQPERYEFVTYRNGVIAQKCGFVSLVAAFNAAIAEVDSDFEAYQSFALA
jgi:hypothetical protein